MMSLRVHTDYDLENMEELQRVVGRRFARRQTVGKRIVFLTWGVCCEAVGLYLALYKDSVVLALGYVPENRLYRELTERGLPAVALGDAVKVGKIVTAIYQAHVLARDN